MVTFKVEQPFATIPHQTTTRQPCIQITALTTGNKVRRALEHIMFSLRQATRLGTVPTLLLLRLQFLDPWARLGHPFQLTLPCMPQVQELYPRLFLAPTLRAMPAIRSRIYIIKLNLQQWAIIQVILSLLRMDLTVLTKCRFKGFQRKQRHKRLTNARKSRQERSHFI